MNDETIERDLKHSVEEALRQHRIRWVCDAIASNPLADGEVVLWRGYGYPVNSVSGALALARAWAAADQDEDEVEGERHGSPN